MKLRDSCKPRNSCFQTVGNFLATSLAGSFLLPLHMKELGASEARLALVMSCYNGAAALFGAVAHLLGYAPMFALLAALLAGACHLAFRLDR